MQVPNIEGQTLTVFDGHAAEPTVFELTTDNNNIPIIIEGGGVPVRVGEAATANQIAAAVAGAINASSVKLFATAVENRIQLRDSVVKSDGLFGVAGIELKGAAAYLGADISMSPEVRGLNVHDQSFTLFDGTSEVTFTLTNDANLVTIGTPIVVSPTTSLLRLQ